MKVTDEMIEVGYRASLFASKGEVRKILTAVFGGLETPPPKAHLVGDLDDKTIVKLLRENLSDKDYDRLTYEKSPPMFPQATYDVPTYALQQFVKAVRAALATTEGSADE